MKKNGILTFLCACVPGAGQMYYGYMQRGLSLISLFMLAFFAAYTLEGALLVGCFIVWMYSFFDTYDLIRHIAAGDPKPDGLLVFGDLDKVKQLLPRYDKLIGWGLVVCGGWLVLRNFVMYLLYRLSNWYDLHWLSWVIDRIPGLLVAVCFIWVGLRLVGLHPHREQQLPPYPGQAEQEDQPKA